MRNDESPFLMSRLLSVAVAVSLVCLASAASGQSFIPPPCTPPGPFLDVPDTHPFCAWIQQLANDQITAGCGGGKYCPDSSVTRAQMAVFLERAMRGTATWEPDRARKYYLTTTTQDGAGADTACAAGYHFASLWEIHDTTPLKYNTTLGHTSADGGQGPPGEFEGWVRTASVPDGSGTIGRANCMTWTTNDAGSSGTIIWLSTVWNAATTVVSPWTGNVRNCSLPDASWCVED
jgi:hypothetical protein